MIRWVDLALDAGLFALIGAERALSLLPPYKCWKAVVLDSVLGPAESHEYVSTTAPSSPPQTIS